jgi:hypothetical protein
VENIEIPYSGRVYDAFPNILHHDQNPKEPGPGRWAFLNAQLRAIGPSKAVCAGSDEEIAAADALPHGCWDDPG